MPVMWQPGLGLCASGMRKAGMFGFIATPCASCHREDYPVWRGTFCGLARCLGREFGNPARLLVNRDAAFMALLGTSLDPAPPRWRKATCCNPFAQPFDVSDDHPAVLHAAAVSVCGLAAKLADDAHDEGFARRGIARLGRLLTASATDRAIAMLNSTAFPTARVMEHLEGQEAIESADPLRADEPTAAAYGTITAHLADLLEIPASRDPLYRAGSALGSLVYWRDAWTDRHDDAKRGRFNSFAVTDAESIRLRIAASWQGFRASLGSLSFPRNAGLLDGVLATTTRLREPFLNLCSEPDERRGGKKRRSGKGSRSDRTWHDCCDCCNCCDCPAIRPTRGGGFCDALFDCGPGDKGCCDCNPCDGCDCCPCH